MDLRLCYNASEDTFPLPPEIAKFYGPFGFPEPRAARRPYVTSNFVMSLDGKASFRELAGRAGGNVVSRSSEDRWMMDFLRAHHDAVLMGAGTLRDEPGANKSNADFAIEDEALLRYRENILGLGRQRIMILSGSGELDATTGPFISTRVEPWVITTPDGEKTLTVELKSLGREGAVKIVATGQSPRVDLAAALRVLREKHGIARLLCEGGPTLYGQLLDAGLIDEDFRTLSMQVVGKSTQSNVERPTPYGNVSYLPETAPWFRMISLHYALPHHAFFRLRYVGPRPT